ncbi:MAG TPA: hypothetical protein VHR72_07150, partial [Gemmataceae bacterium]|nr:hypothetical protein [Gemmataceae bacterium]
NSNFANANKSKTSNGTGNGTKSKTANNSNSNNKTKGTPHSGNNIRDQKNPSHGFGLNGNGPGHAGPGRAGPGGNGPGGNGPTNVVGLGGINNNPAGININGIGGDGFGNGFDPSGFDGGGGGGGGGGFDTAAAGGPVDEDQPFVASQGNSRSLDSGTAGNSLNSNAPQGGTGGGVRPAANFDIAGGDSDPDQAGAPVLPVSQRMFDRRFFLLQNHTGQPIKIYLRYRTLSNRGQWEWVQGAQGDLIYALNPGEERYIGNKNARILADRVAIWARGDNGEHYETYRFKELVLGRPSERDANGDLAYRGSRFGTFTYRFK